MSGVPADAGTSVPRPGLEARVRHLVSIGVLVAQGDRAAARTYMRVALESGVREDAVREVLLQAIAFLGWPRALDGFEALAAVLQEGGAALRGRPVPPASPQVERLDGEGYFRRVYGARADEVLARLRSHHPALGDWVLGHAYGEILCRPGLPPRVRECVALGFLLVLGTQAPFLSHLRGALGFGMSPDQIREVLSQVTLHLPEERVRWAFDLLDRVGPVPGRAVEARGDGAGGGGC